MSDSHLTDIRFQDMDLPQSLIDGLHDAGFTHCTPIQADILPLALKGQDVAGQAQTGTGKTAAFLISTFTHLLRNPRDDARKDNQPRAIIIAPTRELAMQIHKDAVQLGAHTGLQLGLVYGGVDYEKQRKRMGEKIDVLIGTPGRLIDYNKQGAIDLRAIQVAVLDEADRMFDLGFIKDIRFLFRRMPEPTQRQSMLFSATLSHRVMELAYEHMNNPVSVQIEPEQVTAERVTQNVYFPANQEKIPLLLGILRLYQADRAIVFVNTKRSAEDVYAWLLGNDITAEQLSGDVPQKKRQRLLSEFEEGKYQVLIATDVAARGLHIPDVSLVINFDLPQTEEDYVHRIGRTARAGTKGHAVSFACEDTAFYLPDIETYIDQKIPVADITTDLLVEPSPMAKIERRPPPGRRSGGKGGGRSGGPRRPGSHSGKSRPR